MTPHLYRQLTRATSVLVIVLAASALTACGSSSPGATTSTGTTSTSTTGAGFAQQRAAIQACLQKAGITLPSGPAGSATTTPRTRTTPRIGGLVGGSGSSSFANPKVRAALQKCGITLAQRPAGTPQVSNPAYRKAVNNYVACVHKNGYNLPKPNFSGKGPVFNSSQVNRNDPKFKTASAKCQQLLNFGHTQTTTNNG